MKKTSLFLFLICLAFTLRAQETRVGAVLNFNYLSEADSESHSLLSTGLCVEKLFAKRWG